jgi:hypothetical protein
MANPRAREHKIAISVNGREIDGFLEHQIDTSLLEAADSFSLTRPFDLDAWTLCSRDAYVRVTIDGRPRAAGFVDTRRKSAAAGTMTIEGRSRAGRLVQESAPAPPGGATMRGLSRLSVPEGALRTRTPVISAALDESIALIKGKARKKAAIRSMRCLQSKPTMIRVNRVGR